MRIPKDLLRMSIVSCLPAIIFVAAVIFTALEGNPRTSPDIVFIEVMLTYIFIFLAYRHLKEATP